MPLSNITADASSYTFQLRINDSESNVDHSSITDDAIRITGPASFSKLATVTASDPQADASSILVDLSVAGPFSASTNGTFSVNAVAGKIKDTAGNAVTATVIDTFECAISNAGAPDIDPISDATYDANETTFTITPQNSGDTTDVTYSGTNIPETWTLNASTGVLSGSRAIAAVIEPTITATNPGGSDSESFALTFNSVAPANDVLSTIAAGSKILRIGSGQSNFVASGDVIPPNGFTWPARAKFWDETTSSWQLIHPDNGYRNKTTPTVYMALAFEQDYPDLDLYVIDNGTGASGFGDGTDGRFAPGGDARIDLINHITNAIADIQATGETFHYQGFFWIQGEADATPANSSAYETALQGLITEIEGIVEISEADIIPVRLNEVYFAAGTPTIRGVHETIGQKFLDVDDPAVYTLSADDVHYLTYGYRNIGIGLYDIMRSLYTSLITAPFTASGTNQTFAGLSTTPDNWTLSRDTELVFDTDHTVLQRAPAGSGSGIGLYFIESPIIDWTHPVVIEYEKVANNSGIAVGIGRAAFWNSIKGQDSYAFFSANVKYYSKGNPAHTSANPFVDDTKYRTTFTLSGADLTVTTEEFDGTNYQAHSSHIFVNADLSEPRVWLNVQGNAQLKIYQAGQA